MQRPVGNWPPPRPLTFKPRNQERRVSLREFDLDGGDTIIAVFQGNRGAHPDRDIIVKYRQRGEGCMRTPLHLHWAVDLLLKKQGQKALTGEFVAFLIALYDDLRPFASLEDRADRLERQIGNAVNRERLAPFQSLDAFGEYSVEFTGYIIELLGICEKTGDPNAFMFRGVLSAIRDDWDIFSVVSIAGHRGRRA